MRIAVVQYDAPEASELIEEVQQEYIARYGGRDDSPVDPAEFIPPKGLFLLAFPTPPSTPPASTPPASTPLACGGWRSHGDDAELKRMYVRRAARRGGLARELLAELERTARSAGHRRMILETGSMQPEAVALYRSAGYTDIPAFGYYANAPLSIHLAKPLTP